MLLVLGSHVSSPWQNFYAQRHLCLTRISEHVYLFNAPPGWRITYLDFFLLISTVGGLHSLCSGRLRELLNMGGKIFPALAAVNVVFI